MFVHLLIVDIAVGLIVSIAAEQNIDFDEQDSAMVVEAVDNLDPNLVESLVFEVDSNQVVLVPMAVMNEIPVLGSMVVLVMVVDTGVVAVGHAIVVAADDCLVDFGVENPMTENPIHLVQDLDFLRQVLQQ